MEYKVTIMQLNDDCLLHIILLLDQNDQAQLKRVCRRFEQLVSSHWRIKYKEWTRHYNDERGKDEFAWMAFHLHDFVEDLNLGTLLDHDLDILASTKFPNTHTLTADSECIPDTRFDVLVDVFPNLQKLTLEANLELRAIAKLRHLTELKLEYNYYDDVLHFGPIFTQLKLRTFSFGGTHVCETQGLSCIRHCKTLEEVSAAAEILDGIAPMLHELPKLRMIACYAFGQGTPVQQSIFQTIVAIFGKRIHTLDSDNAVMGNAFPMDELSKMKNLERWIMKDVRVSAFCKDRLARDLKNLRELQLRNRKIVKPKHSEYTKCNPLDLIAACGQLKLLAMPYEWLQNDVNMTELWNVLSGMSNPGLKRPLLELRFFHYQPDPAGFKDLVSVYEKQLHITITDYAAAEHDLYSSHFPHFFRMFRVYLDAYSNEIY